MLYGPPSARLVGPSELMAAMDAGGVDRAVVFGFPWQSPELYRRHNDFVMEAVREFPGRLIGFGCFDPLAAGAAEEAERCLAGGLAGIGELAFYRSGIDDAALDALEPVMEVCRRRGRPVLLHTNEPVGHVLPRQDPEHARPDLPPDRALPRQHPGPGALGRGALLLPACSSAR